MSVAQKELFRLKIGRDDIAKAVEFLDASANFPSDGLVYEALITSAIVHFARPFSRNEMKEDRARFRLPDRVIEKLSSAEQDLHAHIMNCRNKAIAHAEWEAYPVNFSTETGVIKSRRYSIYPEFSEIKAFRELAEKLRESLHNEVADQARNLS